MILVTVSIILGCSRLASVTWIRRSTLPTDIGKLFRTRGSRVSSRAPKPGDFSGVRTSRVSLGVPELGVSVPSFFKPISTSRT